ncbi:MAG: TonB-dependent siderophore receptor [Thermoguttaceae bacterium]
MARETALSTGAGKGTKMGSTFAAMAMSAFAMGAPGTTAQASIPPRAVADAVKAYNIPAGSMAAALNAFADRNGLHLLYDARATRRLKSSGLSGVYSVQSGLDRLLKGSGLTYSFASMDGTISIVLAQNDTGTQTDANGAITLPTVDVTANQQGAGGTGGGSFGGAGPAQDPFNTSYVLPDASVGTKTDTPIMDTPLNVQVVSQQVLQDQQVISLDQALLNVSGVTTYAGAFTNGHPYDQIVLRGFPTNNYWIDGFRLDEGSQSTILAQFADVASVEVLKGPSAILYGASDPGGIVNIVTKEPLNTPYYAASQQIGSFNNYRTTLDATGPLTDDKAWLYRMNMSYQYNGAPFGGPVDSTRAQNIFLAPVLKWNIDGATWVKLAADYSNNTLGVFFPANVLYNSAWVTSPRQWNYGAYSPENQSNLFARLSWGHQFDNDWAIKQQIYYNRQDIDLNSIGTSGQPFSTVLTPVPAFLGGYSKDTASQTTYATDVDITGHFDTFGAKHTLLMGGDFYELSQYNQDYGQYPTFQTDIFNPHVVTPFPLGAAPLTPSFENVIPQDNAGLYVQDQLKLPGNFFFLAGARYQYIRSGGGINGYPVFSPTSDSFGHAVDQQAVTPRFGLLYRPEEWVSFYGNYAEGFTANSGEIYPGTAVPPTSAREVETGVKFEFFGGKLRVSADVYNLTKTNVPTPDPNTILAAEGFVVVTGAVRSKGPELDIQGELMPGWSVIVAYTNQDVRVTQANVDVGTGTAGSRFAGIPQNVGRFWTTYEFPQDVLKGFKIGGGVTYTGSSLVFDDTGSSVNQSNLYPKVPAYAIINLMAAYSFNIADTKMTAQVNVTNLLDTTYYTAAEVYQPYGTPGLTTGARTYGAPLTVLGSLSARF